MKASLCAAVAAAALSAAVYAQAPDGSVDAQTDALLGTPQSNQAPPVVAEPAPAALLPAERPGDGRLPGFASELSGVALPNGAEAWKIVDHAEAWSALARANSESRQRTRW